MNSTEVMAPIAPEELFVPKAKELLKKGVIFDPNLY